MANGNGPNPKSEFETENDEIDFSEEESNSTSGLQNPANLFGSTSEVLARYSQCSDCGSHLHFSHSTDFVNSLTHETAKCPECGLKARSVLHRLQ